MDQGWEKRDVDAGNRPALAVEIKLRETPRRWERAMETKKARNHLAHATHCPLPVARCPLRWSISTSAWTGPTTESGRSMSPAAQDDRAFAKRLARYCARNPVALERLTYDRAAKAVTYRSDKSEGPTAGTETADPLEFLARVLTHIPDKGQVTTRYYGWFANRPRGMRRRAEPAAADAPVPIVTAPRLAPTEATRRWAALLQQIFEVDPLSCPKCTGTMRIVACITQSAAIDQILTHLRTRAASGDRRGARSPPSTVSPVARGASRRPTASSAPYHSP
jgi:Putative transposase